MADNVLKLIQTWPYRSVWFMKVILRNFDTTRSSFVGLRKEREQLGKFCLLLWISYCSGLDCSWLLKGKVELCQRFLRGVILHPCLPSSSVCRHFWSLHLGRYYWYLVGRYEGSEARHGARHPRIHRTPPAPQHTYSKDSSVHSVTNAKAGGTSVKNVTHSKTKTAPIHQKYCYLEDNCHQEWFSSKSVTFKKLFWNSHWETFLLDLWRK